MRRQWWGIVAAVIGLFAIWVGQAIPVGAQAESGVEWTVHAQSFESRYPHGFVFTSQITSSAGAITRAQVVWSHVPGTRRSRPAEIKLADDRLSFTWEPQGSDAIPPWLSVTYYWDVSDEAGNSFQTDPVMVAYADESREWVRAESDDAVVFAQGLSGEVVAETLAAMETQRETYRAAWGALLPYKPRVILFGSRSAWREWQVGTNDVTAIGLTRPDWGATVQVVSGGSLHELAYGTVLHEVAHLYQSEYIGFMPVGWFVEGNAAFFELDRQGDYEGNTRALAARGELPVLLDGTGPGVSGRNGRRGYEIGYTFFVWLTGEYGLDGHRQLMTLLGDGIKRNEALEMVTGLGVVEIERRWRVWLGASEVVPTLIPLPTFEFPSPPTPHTPWLSGD